MVIRKVRLMTNWVNLLSADFIKKTARIFKRAVILLFN